MLKILNKLLSSSISMAFLVILGWSVAYSYGWGQSYFYGFPWWYVDVGTSNVARSLAYVIWATSILIVAYLFGVFGLTKAKRIMSENCISLLRAYILCSIFFVPVLIGFILLIGKVNYIFCLGYVILTFGFTLVSKNYIREHINNISIKVVVNFLYRNKNYVMLFTYCYFVLFAFMMGYFRPNFKITFDVLDVQEQPYYVLAKYSDTFILSKSIYSNDGDFYIYKISPNSLCHIKVVNVGMKESLVSLN